MKTIYTLCTLLAFTFSGHAATIIQGTGQDYVKFEAGSYFSLSNTATSVITDNGDGTLTTALRDDSDPTLLTYQIDFDTTGDYYLYFNATTNDGNEDSLYVTAGDFNTTPVTASANDWNSLESLGGTGWTILNSAVTPGAGVLATDGIPSYDGFGNAAGDIRFNLASTASPVELRFIPREAGLTWNSFVLSTDGTLSAAELDGLAVSAIPEPSTLLLVGIAFGSLFLKHTRRK